MARRFFSPNEESDQAEIDEYYEGITAIEKRVLYNKDTNIRPDSDEDDEDDDFDPEAEFGPEIEEPVFGSNTTNATLRAGGSVSAGTGIENSVQETAVRLSMSTGASLVISSQEEHYRLLRPAISAFDGNDGYNTESALHLIQSCIESNAVIELLSAEGNKLLVNSSHIMLVETFKLD